MFDQLTLFQQIALAVIALLNVFAFILYYVDKQRAMKHQYRIPEKTLLLSAFALGGIGAWISMSKFRHKTQHLTFKISVPIAALITVAAVFCVLSYPN